MHGNIVSAAPETSAPPHPPEYLRTMRELLALALGNPAMGAVVEAFAVQLHQHALKIGYDMGYGGGLKEGRIRGRRRAKGLPEIPKPRGRPMGVARRFRDAGLTWEDFPEK